MYDPDHKTGLNDFFHKSNRKVSSQKCKQIQLEQKRIKQLELILDNWDISKVILMSKCVPLPEFTSICIHVALLECIFCY